MTDENPNAGAPSRRIRSFVRREGRITPAQQRALDTLMPRFGVDFAPRPLDLDGLFGRRAHRTLEIGFGNGDNLATLARQHPERDFIGIEVHRPGVGRLLLQLEELELDNVRVICHDAVEVMRLQVPPASLDTIQVYFPDPWPKKRHHKRRLVQPAFVALAARCQPADGRLHLATDWEDYAFQMREVLDASPYYRNSVGGEGFAPRPADRPLTRFEQRGLRRGHAVRDLVYLRTARPAPTPD
ncbi:MAG: tRNA (guanosine(46)-N7)-methyltransferase TrmB [Gammaproteobacteria bacterium]|jgi:tRNA (guanine-N7-)-methyltransferase